MEAWEKEQDERDMREFGAWRNEVCGHCGRFAADPDADGAEWGRETLCDYLGADVTQADCDECPHACDCENAVGICDLEYQMNKYGFLKTWSTPACEEFCKGALRR